jgi:hypothetical protein
MAEPTNAELLRRIAELEAENHDLRQHGSSNDDQVDVAAAGTARQKRSRGWGFTVLSVALITLGALLAPVAVVASWARVALTDTDRFVAAYAGLAEDPQIQAYITDQTLVVINEQVDIPQITTNVIDGITDLGTGPAATQALQLLKGPAASGVESLVRSGITTFVASDAFADVWESALRLSHTQLVSLMANDPDAAVTVGSRGEIGIQLGPIVDAVKVALVDQGIDLANQIPAVDRTIVVAQSDALPSVQLGYGLAIAVGTWLPWVAIVLLAAGVLVARRRAPSAMSRWCRRSVRRCCPREWPVCSMRQWRPTCAPLRGPCWCWRWWLRWWGGLLGRSRCPGACGRSQARAPPGCG